MTEQLECLELCLGMDVEPTNSLLVRFKEKTGKGNIIVGVYYRPPDQHHIDRPSSSWTGLVDEGRAVDIVNLNFRKAFDAVSHKSIKDKLLCMGCMSRQKGE